MAETSDETVNNIEKRINVLIQNLEEKSKQIVGTVRNEVLPQAEATVRENVWVSILTALGFGLILGLVVGLTSGRR